MYVCMLVLSHVLTLSLQTDVVYFIVYIAVTRVSYGQRFGIQRAVFLRKSLPAAEQRFPLKCVFSGSAVVFLSAAAQPRQPFQ